MTTFPDFSGEKSESVLDLHNPSQFSLPVKKNILERLLHQIEKQENITFSHVEIVYVDEYEIIEINKKFLERDYVTDIISFSYDDSNNDAITGIEGTLYCCAPRITEQAQELDSDVKQEFYRIFIHGLLHLAGYNDSTPDEKKAMTKLENHYLKQLGI